MFFSRLCFAAGGILFISFVAQAQPGGDLRREIQKIITFDAEIDFKQTPGLVVGVVLKDSSYIFPFGVRSKEDSVVMNANSLFEIGELTQVFTAAAVVKLSGDGLVDLDSNLAEALGLEVQDTNVRAITIRQCLNHTSGLPRFPPLFGEKEFSSEDPYATYSKEDLAVFLTGYSLTEPPPLPYAFSNMNYAFLEMAVEKATGQGLPAILEQELFLPFGMAGTCFSIPEKDTSLFVQGYSQAGRPAPMWNVMSHKGAFGLKSTPADLIRFMQQYLEPAKDWEAVFSELYMDPVPTGIRKNTWMGYGWHLIYPKRKVRVLAHTGSTGGYMAYMAMVPETGTGVLVLANSPYGVRGLGLLVLRMLNNNWKSR